MAVKRNSLFGPDYEGVRRNLNSISPVYKYVNEAVTLNNEVEGIYQKVYTLYGGDKPLKAFKETINWISTTTGHSFISVIRSMYNYFNNHAYEGLVRGNITFMDAACKYFNTSPPKPKADTEKEDYELLLISLKG